MPRQSAHFESVVRVRLDRGGYLATGPHKGRYFGVGGPLYMCVERETFKVVYVRAATRDDAIAQAEKQRA